MTPAGALGWASAVVPLAESRPVAGSLAHKGALVQFYVQREGDPDWAELTVGSGATVAGLKEAIVKKLQLQERLSSIALHMADVDEDTGAVLRVEEAALPPRKTLAALPALQSGASIVVKVAGAPVMPVPGESPLREDPRHFFARPYLRRRI